MRLVAPPQLVDLYGGAWVAEGIVRDQFIRLTEGIIAHEDLAPPEPAQYAEGAARTATSAELLLGAMKTISVSVVEVNGQMYSLLSPLTEVQKRLLELWELPSDLYEKVARGFLKPPRNTSEP